MQFFFPSSGNDFSRKSWLVETDFRANNGLRKEEGKAVNKRILFSLNKNSDSTSRNEVFVKNIRFHYAEKLLSPAGIYT